jgi:hypothetical protein
MKNIILLLSIIIITSCVNTPKEKQETNVSPVSFIYEATYLDSFKIGDDSKVLLVQEMHQDIISKDYEKVAEYLHDEVVFNLEDGSALEGKETVLKFMKESYSSVEIKDYQVAVNFSVIGDNGDEWVLLWDNGIIETEDGQKSSFSWMEAFMFEGNKILTMNQFSKPRN